MPSKPLRAILPLLLLLPTLGLAGCGSDETPHRGGEGGSPASCTAGEERCEGLVPQTCNSDGTWVGDAACDFVCSEGRCTGVCVPGTLQCDGLVPQLCSAEGAWLDGDPCDSTCHWGECTGACAPASRQCDGLVPQTCSAEGAWANEDACDFVCSAGECIGVCVPGTEQCDGLVPQTCTANGTWLGSEPCDFVCSEGECTGACVPGTEQCDGMVPQTCTAEGAWLGTEACDFVCSAGECIGVCVPGTEQCDGLVPQTCTAEGTWLGSEACDFICSEGECTGACVPGTEQCDGLVPQTCTAEGAWLGGEACDFVCSAGECIGVCVPGTVQCDGLVLQTCTAEGTWLGSEACDFVCSEGLCAGECVPGEQWCTDETTLDTCDATGTWRTSACLQICSGQTERCACQPGYVGDGVVCTPIDFCSVPDGGCSPHATCSQVGTTPSCACNPGYTGDGYTCSATQPQTVLDEGFDDISQLSNRGWVFVNRSLPLGITGWFQGSAASNFGPFASFDGSETAYIGANFNNTANVGTIDNWLATPHLNFGADASVSFYTRGTGGGFADRIEIRLCVTPPCNLSQNESGLGGFTTLLGSVNPTLHPAGYPATWTRFEFANADGLPYSGAGRVAIRYFVTNGGSQGSNSDYIGIDRFVMAVGSPVYSVGGSVSGLNSGSLVLWLNGNDRQPVAGNGSFQFPRRLDNGTPYSVRIYEQPPGQVCTITNAIGSIAAADVDNVQVSCQPE